MRLLTEEWIQFKRSNEDEILAAFQTLDVEKKGFLEQVLYIPYISTCIIDIITVFAVQPRNQIVSFCTWNMDVSYTITTNRNNVLYMANWKFLSHIVIFSVSVFRIPIQIKQQFYKWVMKRLR